MKRRTLKPHQASALAWSTPRSTPAFFLQMRLGKTLVAIRWSEQLDLHGPRLVVAPLAVLYTWQDELAQEGHASTLLLGSREDRLRLLLQPTDWFLVNYEGLFYPGHKTSAGKPKPVPSEIATIPWSLVILDESTRIRNPKAITTRVCLSSFQKVPFKAILSGLPNPEGVEDFFCQMAFLRGHFMGCDNYWKWLQRHFQLTGFYDWSPRPGMLPLIRDAVKAHALFMTRKEVGLANERIYSRRYIVLPERVQTTYDRCEEDFAFEEKETMFRTVQYEWLQQIATGYPKGKKPLHDGKTRELIELLKGELKGESVVVYCYRNAELVAVERALRAAGIRCRRIIGAMKPRHRRYVQDLFQKGTVQVLVCQIRCVKFGLNLSKSSTAVFFSNSPSLEERKQCEDRIEHISKKEPLLFIDLLAKNTVDEDIQGALTVKGLVARNFNEELLRRFHERRQGVTKSKSRI